MATRRSLRIKKNTKLSDLDQFRHTNDDDVDMSDSNKNTRSKSFIKDDVSSASSEDEESQESEEDSNISYSDSEESSASSASSEVEEESQESEDPADHPSDSDYNPNKRKTSRSKKKPRKKKVLIKKRGRKRKRSDDDSASSSASEEPDFSGSDEEYQPNTSQTRKKRKKNKDINLDNVRRSTRNLGRLTKKYNDETFYGEIPGLYDSDTNAKEAKKKTYKNIAKKRKRGGIKKLKHKNVNTNKSTSASPNTKRKFKITHKAWKKKNSKEQSDDSDEEYSQTNSENTNNSREPSSKVVKKEIYTYTSWLDSIVSDTECTYLSRNRLFPAKINHVTYTFEVQTEVGLESFTPESGKIKISKKPSEDDNDNNNDNNENKMDVDDEEDDDIKKDIKIEQIEDREWYTKLKIGDSILCLGEDNEWHDHQISFINRRFDLQYLMRKSMNYETIYEYDQKTLLGNPIMRQKMRPSSSVYVDDTPEPLSPSKSPKKKNKKSKKNRFGDSDESESESEEEESAEESSEYDEDDDVSQSRTQSVSPMDDLQTKIEIIMFEMKLPRSTVCWKDTFTHLITDTQETEPNKNKNINPKQEMDIDEVDVDVPAPPSPPQTIIESTPTIDEKQDKDKDTEMEDNYKENSSPLNKKPADDDDNGMMIESDDEPEDDNNNKKESQLINKYLVKYWNRSYHHLEWLTTRQLRELDAETKRVNFTKKFDEYDRKVKKIHNAINQKKYKSVHFFNELYLEIDRIISYAEPGENFDTVSGYTSSNKQFQINTNTSTETMYLVKWKGMQYDEATWEMESFLKTAQFEDKYHGTREIELLIQRQKIPANRYLHPQPRKLNVNYFKNKPSKKERVSDGQIFKNGHTLRGRYQKDGVNWLINNWQFKIPCILADEMGLGKTIQTVTFINYLFSKYNRRGPYLIVAPLSTLGHWQREFRAWSDMNVIVYHGSASSRDRIVHEEFEWLWTDSRHPRAKTAKELRKLNTNNFKFHVMITTPQIVNQDEKILSSILWNTIVVDEAHSLKSHKSLFYRTLRTFKNTYTHTVLLTGTPIQNNMEELWCLLHFMDPTNFPDQEEFAEKFSNLAESKSELKKLLDVRLLQRLKYLVEKDLCQREEKIIWVELTLFQKKWYKALYQRSYEKLKACGAAKCSLMNVAMQLRKCCNHPFLMTDVEKTMSPPGTDDVTMNENLIKSSGKLVLLDKLLPKLRREGHRILIFSQMSHLLDILEDYLNYRQHLYERLDGSVTGIERQEAIDRFQRDDSIFVFLLTTRAGGVGINLMAADTVIIYDSDWNPMNDVQAIARCHRIGQKKQVNVYRLITRNCYEESMFKRADQKLALNKVVMGDMKDMGKSDINDMLKKGAIAMFLKDVQTDDDIKKFANADIDEILARRTETVKHDAETNDPDAAMFSEAVFVAHADDANVNVDDENFWEVLGVGNEEEQEDIYTSPFMRRRRTRNSTISHTLAYDSDGFSLDGNEFAHEIDDGTTLLGALSYIIYGKWQEIYDDLTQEEKIALKLVKEEDEDDEEQDDDVKIEEKEENLKEEKKEEDVSVVVNKIQDWQVDILRQASIETICKMANLMRPNIRNTKLGVNFSKLQSLFYEKTFRCDAVNTLAEQIYAQELICADKWKAVIAEVWKIKDEKNRFVDKKQLINREFLCKMGCKRLNNKSINPNSGKVYDTCCGNCANNVEKKKDLVHENYCEKRHYNDWRLQIRDEALKVYLKKHPLTRIISEDNKEDEKYAFPPLPIHKEEVISYIVNELKYHNTDKLVLSMRTQFINVKSLRDELKNKTHGDIVSILLKLERMFKFKILCALNKGKIKKLDFSKFKKTKAMPEWFEQKWGYCMVEGTLKYGWGNVPGQFARENYEFTPTYKGFKKVKKPTKKQKLELQKLKDIKNGLQNVQIKKQNNDGKDEEKAPVTGPVVPVVVVAPPPPPVLIVKKRQWITEGKKQETILISICNHFRKGIREKYKKMTAKIKTANKLREQQVFNPSSFGNNHNSLGKEMNDMIHTKKKKKKTNKKHKEKVSFDKANDIKNYFHRASNGSNPNLPNAFDILGKKKKKKKSKYDKIKTKLTISFDEAGNFKVPIKITRAKMVTNLGEICIEKGYHATSYIYPVGYKCVIANLPSLKRPGATTTFTTVIKKGDGSGPLFEITCSDDPDFKLCAKSPSKVWGQLKQYWIELEDDDKDNNNNKNTNNSNNNSNVSASASPTKKKASGHGISGPQKIGLAHADIKRVIECLPNALKCSNYKFRYRMDKDEALTAKKAFKKTLKVKKEKNKNKEEKKSKIKSPKKPKKPAPKTSGTTINNIKNINNINIINNISSVNIMACDSNSNSNSNSGNMSNISNMKENAILIEDSPAAVNPNIVATAVQKSDIASRTGSEVIDLCDSDNDENRDKNKNKKQESKAKKQSRKRKYPSSSSNSVANNDMNKNAFGDNDNDQPKKKRRINKQQKLEAIWSKTTQE